MVDRLIATTPATGYRQLGVHGQPVVGAHRQLKAILTGNLSPDHAALLTQPRIDPQGGRIDWYSDRPGPSGRVADLPADMQAAAQARAETLIADIRGLADKLAREGGASELVGHMLTLAVTTPGPEWLYVSADQPLLVLWGHDREGVAAAPAAASPPPTRVATTPAASSASPSHPQPGQQQPGHEQPAGQQPPQQQPTMASGPAIAMPPATGRGPWGWLLWLLPLLLLAILIALAFRACQPLPPVVVEVPGAAPPAADPAPALEARIAALESERDRLRHEAEALPRCVPIDPAPPQKAEDLPPLPQPLPPNKAEQTPEPPKVEPPSNKAEVAPTPVPQVKPEPPPAPKPSPSPVNKAEAPAPSPAPTPPPAPQASCQTTYAPGDEPEVVLIVDGSGSMKEPFPGASSRIDMAKRSVDNMVRGLPPGIEVGLIDFQSCDNVRRDKFYGDAERGQLIGEVSRLSPWGGTPLARSIERAGNIVSGDVESVIVVVSDGEESCGGDPCAAARALKAAKPKAIVNVIDISGDAGSRAVIQCVAQATGGQVLKADSAQDMMRKMQQATRQPDMRACKK